MSTDQHTGDQGNLFSGSKISSEPFFIFGCGRSGTSLLSRMLDHHPHIAVPYESHLFNTFERWIEYYGDLSNAMNLARLIDDILSTDVMRDWDPRPDREAVLALIRRNDLCGVFEAIMSAYCLATGKKRWGEKTPHHVFFWNSFSHFFPSARIIHIFRDGRDVALSLMRARFGPKTIFGCARYWQTYLTEIENFKRKVPRERIYEVSYEALLKKPETELRRICHFLGEEYVPEMLDFYKNKSAYKTDSRNLKNLASPLLRNNFGKWRKYMSAADVEVFEWIAGSELKRYGYRLSSAPVKRPSRAKILLTRFLGEPALKLAAMARNRKGHRDAFRKIRIYLRLRTIDRIRYNRSGKREV